MERLSEGKSLSSYVWFMYTANALSLLSIDSMLRSMDQSGGSGTADRSLRTGRDTRACIKFGMQRMVILDGMFGVRINKLVVDALICYAWAHRESSKLRRASDVHLDYAPCTKLHNLCAGFQAMTDREAWSLRVRDTRHYCSEWTSPLEVMDGHGYAHGFVHERC